VVSAASSGERFFASGEKTQVASSRTPVRGILKSVEFREASIRKIHLGLT